MNQRGQGSRAPKQPSKSSRPNNYAFIDSQNLNLGVQKVGWKMDWRRFRLWLAEKYGVTHAYMFIGYMAENENLYELMHEHGFLVVLKPTTEIKAPEVAGQTEAEKEAMKPTVKGNIDADLVLHAMKELRSYDQALIVSGDGDFFGLIEYLASEKKLLKVLTPNQRYSTLLKPFEAYIENLDQHRRELAYHDHRHPRKPKA
ncbi:MAG: NYN domain-containing protein [Candidatus Saccharibacteria bacterium]